MLLKLEAVIITSIHLHLLIQFKVMLVLEPMPVANCVIHFLCCGFAIFQSSFLVWSHVFSWLCKALISLWVLKYLKHTSFPFDQSFSFNYLPTFSFSCTDLPRATGLSSFIISTVKVCGQAEVTQWHYRLPPYPVKLYCQQMCSRGLSVSSTCHQNVKIITLSHFIMWRSHSIWCTYWRSCKTEGERESAKFLCNHDKDSS